ncbi:hypothetical protein ACHAPX_006504 [Trichoderma viride]
MKNFLIHHQVVSGPNSRTDYDINPTPEWFYQYKGTMVLEVVDNGIFRDILVREGDMFLLRCNTPHNSVRFANTIGLVLEQRCPEDAIDRLRWYCANCGCVVYEIAVHLTDLGTQLKAAIGEFHDDDEKRTCHERGEIEEAEPKPASIKDANLERVETLAAEKYHL